jgi:hypothetical protein
MTNQTVIKSKRRDRVEIDWITPIIPRGPLTEPLEVTVEAANHELETLNRPLCTCEHCRRLGISNQVLREESEQGEQECHRTPRGTESP